MQARSQTNENIEATIRLLLLDHAAWLQREPRTTQEVMGRFCVPMVRPECDDAAEVQRISYALFDAGYTPHPKTHTNPRWHWERWPPAAAPSSKRIEQPLYSSGVTSRRLSHQQPTGDGLQVQRVERGLFIIAQRPPDTAREDLHSSRHSKPRGGGHA